MLMKKNGGIILEGCLCAVAVMHVEIHDGDRVHAVAALQISGGDGDVAEKAEAHCAIRLGVMAGRADGCETRDGRAHRLQRRNR